MGKKPNPDKEPKKETTPDKEEEETSDEESEEKTNGSPSGDPSQGGTPNNNNNPGGTPNDNNNPGWGKTLIGAAVGATVVAGAAVVGIPACIAGLGFTTDGIAAGSVAAKMMSAAAIANGGGVPPGSTVAVLQSVGAKGFSLATNIGLTSGLGSAGAAIGAWWTRG